jgi:nicotinamidase-related amidase
MLACLDLQRTNLTGDPEGCESAWRTAPCRRLLAHARRQGWFIVHVHRIGTERPDAVNAPIPGFEPRPTEPVYLRRGVSALANSGFAEIVRATQGGEILLMGFDLRTSGLATALDAFNQDAPLTLVRDAFWAARVPGGEAGAPEEALWQVATSFARTARLEDLLEPRRMEAELALAANDA